LPSSQAALFQRGAEIFEPAKPVKLLVSPSEFLEESLAFARGGRRVNSEPDVDLGYESVDRARRVELVPQQAGDLGLGDVSPHEDVLDTLGWALFTTATPAEIEAWFRRSLAINEKTLARTAQPELKAL
jgi:hypothetical protein